MLDSATAIQPSTPPEQGRAADDDQFVEIWLHGRSEHTARAYESDVDRLRSRVGKPFAAILWRTCSGSPIRWTERRQPVLNTLCHEIAARFRPSDRDLPFDVGRPGAAFADGGQITLLGKGSVTRSIQIPASVWNLVTGLRPPKASIDDPVFWSQKEGWRTPPAARGVEKSCAPRPNGRVWVGAFSGLRAETRLQSPIMVATTHPMTVAEFRKLPEDAGPIYHELRHGEVVPVTRPKFRHFRIQKRLEQLLEPLAENRGVVAMELAFRPIPEHELWAADVVYLSQERWTSIDPEDNLAGAPDLVIEVLSPSNTVAEIYDKEKLCLENGAKEFWVVDPDHRQVKISTPDGRTVTYQSGQEIPLPLLGGAKVAVAAIFA